MVHCQHAHILYCSHYLVNGHYDNGLIVFSAADLRESDKRDSYFAHVYKIVTLKRAVYLCL